MAMDTTSPLTPGESGEEIRVLQGGPDTTTAVLVAECDQFRILGEHTMVLYLAGAHIPRSHAGLPYRPAVLLDGVYRPGEATAAAPRRGAVRRS